MNYIQTQDILKAMSNSFFVSEELVGKVTPNSLTDRTDYTPFIVIDNKSMVVSEIKTCGENKSDSEIRVKFELDTSIKIKKKFIIDGGSIFGNNLKEKKGSFKYISFDSKQKKYFCEIIIEEEEYWS